MNSTTLTLGNANAIPAEETEAAEAFFATFTDSDDPRAADWRRRFYIDLRTGWNRVARRHQDNFVTSHDEALELVAKHCACLHDWQHAGHYDDTNRVLGTYTRGHRRVCTKCAKADVVIDSRNNWSGD